MRRIGTDKIVVALQFEVQMNLLYNAIELEKETDEPKGGRKHDNVAGNGFTTPTRKPG